MPKTLMEISQGERLAWSLGPRLAGETVTSVLKLAGPGKTVPPASWPVALTCSVEAVDDVSGAPGWIISSDETDRLLPGHYVVDERIVLDDNTVQLTDPSLIYVRPSVTGGTEPE